MTRYFFVVPVMGLIGVTIIVKGTVIMFVEQQYWQDVVDRSTKESVTVKPNRGNIFSSDGKLMTSPLPEYRIYTDFKAGGQKKDTMLMSHLGEICEGLHRTFPDKSAAESKRHPLEERKKRSHDYPIYPRRISYIQYKEAKRLPVFNLNKYKSGFYEQTYNQRKEPFGSLVARTLGDLYADTAQGAKNGIELTFDTLLKGRDGITHRQKVMNKYLNIVDIVPVDGCDVISIIDVGMQGICEKALIGKLKEINANVGVAVLMEVQTGEVEAIVNMMKADDGKYYEMCSNAISDMLGPGFTFKTASIMVALEDGKITPDIEVDTGNGIMIMYGRAMKDYNWYRGGHGETNITRTLEVLSNIGVSHLIDKHYGDNPQKLVDGLKRIGIDRPPHLQIAEEGKPNIHGPRERYFSKTTLPWMSIGYKAQVPSLNIPTFYNAIVNNGTMVHLRSAKAAVKDDEVIHELPTEIINPRICSDYTLIQVREVSHKVVSEGLAKSAGSKQFAVADKTDTAQISQSAAGCKAGQVNYPVSFCRYFSAEVPKYSCIVSIQKPGLSASEGLMAGSVLSKIVERAYTKNLRFGVCSAMDSTTNVTPTVRVGEMNGALYVLDALDVPVQEQSEAKKGQELWGHSQAAPSAIILQSQKSSAGIVPSIAGMGAKDAAYLLERKGLKVHLNGVGKVRSQSVPGGSRLARGQTINLTLY